MKVSKIVGVCAVIASCLWGQADAQEKANVPDQYAESTIFVNLGDYAKGDGTDETEAVQKAFDALVSLKKNWNPGKDGYPHRNKRGVLWIPSPAKFYGISRTINVHEKWNVEIKCETPSFPGMQIEPYFVWLGPDKGEMFNFNNCGAINVENLSMSGSGKKVTGIMVGTENVQGGFLKYSSFSRLYISDVAIGMRLGGNPNNGADIAMNSYRDVVIKNYSEYGLIGSSGNLATQTFMNLSSSPDPKTDSAKHAVMMLGGQIVLMNSCLGGGPSKTTGACVGIYAGGVNIYGCWSEWRGPFLYGNPMCPQAGRVSSPARYSTILQGIQHYPGGETQFWRKKGGGENPESDNPVPISIDWDMPTPLTLVNCSFWGGVKLGTVGQSSIIDIGTTFSNRDGLRFIGEGIEKYGRIVHVGSLVPGTRDVIDPYVIDRRNTPGTEAPKTGVWKKGDCIRNTEPDPAVPAKAVAGWICVESGEPGTWTSFGVLGKEHTESTLNQKK